MPYQAIDLGLTDYKQAYALQRYYLSRVKEKYSEGYIIFTEHRPVFTLGRRADPENFLINTEAIRSRSIGIVNTDRGGDITFHGPG